MAIIEVNHVTKEYQLGQLQSLKDTLLSGFARLQGKKRPEPEKFKALDDISFKIEKGEVVGIIGHNGAGKSTLLKTLSQITTPTSGNISVKGKIAPLIEVGAGLIPDLTGRENIILNSTILGISKKEIYAKMDGIIEFAELEEFIDTPVKRYSSGMKVKLGFSIATSLNAEILIVDEVLAVGDLAFQRKCFDRMENLIKQQGKTVLLVSHNIRQIERLCTRVIMLEKGVIIADSTPKKVTELFFQKSNKQIQEQQRKNLAKGAQFNSSGDVTIEQIDILNEKGIVTEQISSGKPLQIRVRLEIKRALKKPEIVIGTHRTDFVYLSANSTAIFDDRPDLEAGSHEITQILPGLPLTEGIYCVRVAIFEGNGRTVFMGETLKNFDIINPTPPFGQGTRSLEIPVDWLIDGKAYNPTC